jgi:hypothetical protein
MFWRNLPLIWLLSACWHKSRKAPIDFVMSVVLSVRLCQRRSHWTDFHEIWYRWLPRKSVDTPDTRLESDKNIGQFTWRPKCVLCCWRQYTVFCTSKIRVVHRQPNSSISMATLIGFLNYWQLNLRAEKSLSHAWTVPEGVTGDWAPQISRYSRHMKVADIPGTRILYWLSLP